MAKQGGEADALVIAQQFERAQRASELIIEIQETLKWHFKVVCKTLSLHME